MRATDLREHVVGVGSDLHEGYTTAPLRRVSAHLGQPAVVSPRAGEPDLGIHVAGQAEPDTEGCARAALDRVSIRVDDFGSDAVVVHLLVAPLRVPAALETLLVLGEPLLRKRAVRRAHP